MMPADVMQYSPSTLLHSMRKLANKLRYMSVMIIVACGFASLAFALLATSNAPDVFGDWHSMYVQVNFLGTGSAEPSKYRGASAIHIR